MSRALKQKIMVYAASAAQSLRGRGGKYARTDVVDDPWTGVAIFPEGGPPHYVPGCLSRREARALAAAEGRIVWRRFREHEEGIVGHERAGGRP